MIDTERRDCRRTSSDLFIDRHRYRAGGMERGRPRSFDKDAALGRAMEVFWVKGYEGSSMSDLTAAMGIASPSLYAAFGSKEELFRQALKHYSDTEGRHIWHGVESAGT